MKTPFLLMVAAGMLSLASAAEAGNRRVDAYLAAVGATAEARLESAGVQLAQPLELKGTVGGDGRINNVRPVTTGSVETDQKVRQALARLTVPGPPVELAGRDISLTLDARPFVQAKTP